MSFATSLTEDTLVQMSLKEPWLLPLKTIGINTCGKVPDTHLNLKEVCPPRLFVSNAFSPDRDAINDQYNVHSAHVGKFQMLIFNRWGEIIFESRDKNHFWDGIYRDEPMPIGVYPWIIVYEGDSEEYKGPYRMEGSVTVVR